MKAAAWRLETTMSVYTVHEAPARAGASSAAERFVFVRDGFSWWAFLFAPLWMLWHRMWLVFLGYAVISGGIEFALVRFGASRAAISLVGLVISLLVGLEASTLRRLTLHRRGWTNVGVVSGDKLEDAERRFFDAWVRGTRPANSAAHATTPVPAGGTPVAVPRVAQTPPHVVGLFPEPGAGR
jgi:hypothetical protein